MAEGGGYLKPKVGSPAMLRSENNGMFKNPPLWMTWGGLDSAQKLHRGTTGKLQLEKHPSAKRGKPI